MTEQPPGEEAALAALEDEVRWIAAIRDPLQRTIRAHRLHTALQVLVGDVGSVRRGGMRELAAPRDSRRSALTAAEIAREIGLSRARVSRIMADARPERELIATGHAPVTIAIGGKQESPVRPNLMVSAEADHARDLLQALCVELDLSSSYEIVPPPGIVHLNRPNLVVLCSPRILPIVGQSLEADNAYGFANSARGWYLLDRRSGEKFRSPSDDGEPADYGYIGRLPRPDGKGTFLYMAGIHAIGTWGAARHLSDNITDIYRHVRDKPWSMLVRVNYDPDTKQVTSTEILQPIQIEKGA